MEALISVALKVTSSVHAGGATQISGDGFFDDFFKPESPLITFLGDAG
jgi:hypothetical protein